MSRLDEFSLIRMLTERQQSPAFLRKQGVAVGIGDDAAVVGLGNGKQFVLTCDTLVEGIHFHRWTMLDEDIGYKAMAANISDIAAMGAVPKYALVSVSVPKTYSQYRLKRIYAGLFECAHQYEVAIVGGDTTSSRKDVVLTVTLIGEVEVNRALLRSTAQPGDVVFITGVLGRSAAGLHFLMSQKKSHLRIDNSVPPLFHTMIQAHRRPQPSVEAGRILLRSGCHALNDISDGLANECWEIAEASNVGLVLEEARIPIPSDLTEYANRVNQSPLDWILYGGEDYVLLGTMPVEKFPLVKQRFAQAGLEIYRIGQVTVQEKGVLWIDHQGHRHPVEKKGYHHF